MRLFWKIYLLSLSSLLFCTVLLTGIISYRGAEHSLGRLRTEQRLLAVTAASQVETGYHDQVWPFEMLSAIAKEKEFVSWQIVDGNEKVVLSNEPVPPEINRELSKGTPQEPSLVTLEGTDREFWIVPMRMRDGRRAWQFRLGFHTDSVRAQIRSIVTTNALVGSLIALLFLGVSLYVTHRVLRPLNSLTLAVGELERGAVDVTLPPAGKDEIGRLVTGFTAMVRSISDRDAKIQEHLGLLEAARADLETRVALRTQELHASETRVRAIIESAADAIVTLDGEGQIVVWNPAASAMFGLSPEEARGKGFSSLVTEDHVLRLDRMTIESVGPGGDVVDTGTDVEIRGRRRDGETFPIHVSLSEVWIDGKLLCTAIVRDISDRKRAENEKQELHQRLVIASRQAGMAEVASNVLHNVGNVLNSVNVSATVVGDRIAKSKAPALGKVVSLFNEHQEDIGRYLTEDDRGKLLPAYLDKLSEALVDEQRQVLVELQQLTRDIGHIKQIIRTQQSYAKVNVDIRELVVLTEVIEDAFRISGSAVGTAAVDLHREYGVLPKVRLDRHKMVHILVNLINNAKHAIAGKGPSGFIRLSTRPEGPSSFRVEVVDNGVGISQENLLRVFHHGFTTKPDGHGFGLHGAALSAKELGGALTASSEGPGKGACFALILPVEPAEVAVHPSNSPATESHHPESDHERSVSFG